jgi:hypothetical protein
LLRMSALARRTCQRTELGDLRPQRRCRCVVESAQNRQDRCSMAPGTRHRAHST